MTTENNSYAAVSEFLAWMMKEEPEVREQAVKGLYAFTSKMMTFDERTRHIVLSKLYNDATLKEMGQRFGITPHAVWQRWRKACKDWPELGKAFSIKEAG